MGGGCLGVIGGLRDWVRGFGAWCLVLKKQPSTKHQTHYTAKPNTPTPKYRPPQHQTPDHRTPQHQTPNTFSRCLFTGNILTSREEDQRCRECSQNRRGQSNNRYAIRDHIGVNGRL